MAWYAKLTGGYSITSDEGKANILAYKAYMGDVCSNNNLAGQLANVYAESGLNPWRFQGDSTSGAGYGLYQFTPKANYFAFEDSGYPNFSPNYQVEYQSSGASPNDAICQMYVFRNGIWGWQSSCWRTYWDADDYPELYSMRQIILDTYGDGSSLTQSQYFTIDNAYYACFAFLACFEGPSVPNYEDRIDYISDILDVLGSDISDLIRYGGIRDVLRRLIIRA